MYAFLKRVKGHIQMIIKLEESEEETEEDTKIKDSYIIYASGDTKQKKETCLRELFKLARNGKIEL